MPSRSTARKRAIRNLLETSFADTPVLLDELRWAVFVDQLVGVDDSESTITRSWQNSFARTVREQLPEYRLQKIAIDEATPVGLVARTALYRLKSVADVRRFLSATNPCVLCRWKTDMDVDEPRYQSRYVTPHYHVATFRFFDERPKAVSYSQLDQFPGSLIPATQKLTLVVRRGLEVKLATVATIPWKLYGCHFLSKWYEVDVIDPLAAVGN